MRDLVILAAGMIVGNWWPPLIARLLTRTERNGRRVRRPNLEQLIADVNEQPTGGHAVPRQYAWHHIDGTPAAETARFGLDRRDYEIDLTEKNTRALRKDLQP